MKGARRFAFVFLAWAVLAAGTAWGAGPQWLPSFPLRAGDNILLMWLPVPGAQSYNVYRSEPGKQPEKIATTAAPTHTDAAPDKSKTLEYTVRAVVNGQEGEPSSKGLIAGVEPLAAPKFAGFRELEPGKTSILWDSVPKAVFYNLYKSATKDGEYKLVTSAQESRYVETGIKPGETVFYKVSAVNQSSVESPKSEPLAVKIEVKKEVVAKPSIPVVARPFKKSWTATGEKDNYLASARDVALTKEGDFAVVSGPDVQVIGRDGVYRSRFGGAPPGKALGWGSASGIGVAPGSGAFVVVYQFPGFVRTFDADGTLRAEAEVAMPDPKTTTDGRVLAPIPADADFAADGTIWVTENANCQLIHYDASLKEIGRVSKPIGDKKRNPKEELVLPGKIAIDRKSGKIFVAEGIESRVSMYDGGGKRLGQFGSMGSGAGEFNSPAGLYVTPAGELLVGDANLARIQAFDLEGKYLGTYQDASLKKPEAVGYPNGLAAAGTLIVYSEDVGRRIVAYEAVK